MAARVCIGQFVFRPDGPSPGAGGVAPAIRQAASMAQEIKVGNIARLQTLHSAQYFWAQAHSIKSFFLLWHQNHGGLPAYLLVGHNHCHHLAVTVRSRPPASPSQTGPSEISTLQDMHQRPLHPHTATHAGGPSFTERERGTSSYLHTQPSTQPKASIALVRGTAWHWPEGQRDHA